MKRLLLVVPVLAAGVIGLGLFLSFNLTRAQNTNVTMGIDWGIVDNTYIDTTNTMTVVFNPATDFCLASATATTITHTHQADLLIQNVEDLVGWQLRLNYTGDRMRPLSQVVTPFTDSTTGDPVGFTNLPIDQTTFIHRTITAASSIPPGAPGPQTALIGATYNGTQTFPISPDTPAKTTPDDTSYSAPSGGVISRITFQVVGDQTGQTLDMDLSDNVPNPPGSSVVFWNGTGITTIQVPEAALGDAQHVEGGACQAATPSPTESPSPTPSPTASPRARE